MTFQLPGKYTPVMYLTDSIQCSDAEIQDTLAAVRANKTEKDALCNNFENCVVYLLPSGPVAKKRKNNHDGRPT